MLDCDGSSGFLKVYRVYRWSSWISEGKGGPGLSLAVVRDLREARVPAGPDELLAFETDVLAGDVDAEGEQVVVAGEGHQHGADQPSSPRWVSRECRSWCKVAPVAFLNRYSARV